MFGPADALAIVMWCFVVGFSLATVAEEGWNGINWLVTRKKRAAAAKQTVALEYWKLPCRTEATFRHTDYGAGRFGLRRRSSKLS